MACVEIAVGWLLSLDIVFNDICQYLVLLKSFSSHSAPIGCENWAGNFSKSDNYPSDPFKWTFSLFSSYPISSISLFFFFFFSISSNFFFSFVIFFLLFVQRWDLVLQKFIFWANDFWKSGSFSFSILYFPKRFLLSSYRWRRRKPIIVQEKSHIKFSRIDLESKKVVGF